MEKVACYIRVSSQEQKLHGISLDAQKDKLTDYAEKNNLKIVDWYCDEGISGRKLIKNRPELQRMLNDAQAKRFERIIFIKLDRFFRSVAEYHECMKKITPVLWTATEEKYDLTTANGRAFVNMKLTIAELEADQTGERIKIVNDYKVKVGGPLTGSQSQGIAFKVEKIDGVKRVVQDPDTKDLCNDYISHFLTYQNKRQAVQYVNQKYGTSYHYNAFCHMLNDTKLYGFYRGNADYCPAYITKDTFDRIQNMLSKNLKRPQSNRIYIFSGLIKCPVCGHAMAGTCSNIRTNIKPNGKVYVYNNEIKSYRCNQFYVTHLCLNSKTANEKHIEEQLLRQFDNYVSVFISEAEIEESVHNKNTAAISKKIAAVNIQVSKIKHMYLRNDLTEAEYDKAMEELKEELAALNRNLVPNEHRDLNAYKELLQSDWKSLYNALSEVNKRAFWRRFIKEIKVNRDGCVESVIFF